ncbi:MAG: hypothetical protein KJ058_01670 [Thermoanaerobaculia bacterium]|nr:hypothetical protein [Thermoanaerobaculia bacterium]MCZ7651181.1 hypothetical protein [Thermoanaerobaculia bacterium]
MRPRDAGGALWRAVAETARRPGLAAALAAPGLLSAWLVVAPARRPLARALDFAPDAGAAGAADLGLAAPGLLAPPDLSLLLHGGELSDLVRALAAHALPASALACAALLGLLHGPLQCAGLDALRKRSVGPGALLAAAARFALPASALSLLALAGYALSAALGLRLLGAARSLAGDEAPNALGVAAIGSLVVVLLFAVRSLLDISRARLVERGPADWLRPALAALARLPRLAPALALLYVAYGTARVLLLAGAWSAALIATGSWLGLALAFAVQQALAAAAAGLRLARLQAVRRLLLLAEARSAPPAYKVEVTAGR